MPKLSALLRPRARRRAPAHRPTHVGVVMDGNRRWAKAAGYADPSIGHRVGAHHVEDVLGWCESRGIEHLTVYVLSADNIAKRSEREIGQLMALLESVIVDTVTAAHHPWQVHLSGDLTLLPPSTAAALDRSATATLGRQCHLTLAIGYDGRQDIVRAVRATLLALTDVDRGDVDERLIGAHFDGGPVSEIDLVIRTSGEQRLSGFFPWQSAAAEIYVSPKMWPAFTERDFDDALRWYAARRQRR